MHVLPEGIQHRRSERNLRFFLLPARLLPAATAVNRRNRKGYAVDTRACRSLVVTKDKRCQGNDVDTKRDRIASGGVDRCSSAMLLACSM